MSDKIELKDLKRNWERSKIKHVIEPAARGVRITPTISEILRALSNDELIMVTEALWQDYVELNDTMICKKIVARLAGMTVSWLDNSYCEKARKLRAIGVRYGTSQTSPVRFQRSLVQEILRTDEVDFLPPF